MDCPSITQWVEPSRVLNFTLGRDILSDLSTHTTQGYCHPITHHCHFNYPTTDVVFADSSNVLLHDKPLFVKKHQEQSILQYHTNTFATMSNPLGLTTDFSTQYQQQEQDKQQQLNTLPQCPIQVSFSYPGSQ
eukprot:UN09964